MVRTAFPAMSRAAVVAALAGHPAGPGPNVIENRGQAMPKGARRAIEDRAHAKAVSRAAAQELIGISNQTLVVAHLHPRWLRKAVEDMMDTGANVTLADVQTLRDLGPAALLLREDRRG